MMEEILEECVEPGCGLDLNLRAYVQERCLALEDVILAHRTHAEETELYRALAFFWLELRFEWVRYNRVMQRQLQQHGEPDAQTFVRGSLVSALLGLVEGVLSPGDIERLQGMAVEPLLMFCPDPQRVRDFVQSREVLARRLDAVLERSLQPLHRLRQSLTGSPDTAGSLLECCVAGLADLQAVSQETAQLPAILVWPELRASLPLSPRLDVADVSLPGAALDVRAVLEVTRWLPRFAHALLQLLPDTARLTLRISITGPTALRLTVSPAPPESPLLEAGTTLSPGVYTWQWAPKGQPTMASSSHAPLDDALDDQRDGGLCAELLPFPLHPLPSSTPSR